MRILVGKNYIEIKRVKSDQLLLGILVISKFLEKILQYPLQGAAVKWMKIPAAFTHSRAQFIQQHPAGEIVIRSAILQSAL